MKKRNMAALALLAVMLLTACGRAESAAVTTKEIVVPEMSSKDMLVNSLEYLLEEEEREGEETGQDQEPETAADHEAEETDKAQEKAVICYGRDMDSGLTREEIAVEEITPDVLLNALARHNIVPLLDTKALSAEEREEEGRKLLYLDISGSFREYLMTMSAEAECIILSSIANTFLSNYDIDAVYITVEGETLVTPRAEYREAFSDNTPEEMLERLTAGNETEKDVAEPEEE